MSECLETTADKFIFKVKKGLLYSRDDVWIDVSEDRSKMWSRSTNQREDGYPESLQKVIASPARLVRLDALRTLLRSKRLRC